MLCWGVPLFCAAKLRTIFESAKHFSDFFAGNVHFFDFCEILHRLLDIYMFFLLPLSVIAADIGRRFFVTRIFRVHIINKWPCTASISIFKNVSNEKNYFLFVLRRNCFVGDDSCGLFGQR